MRAVTENAYVYSVKKYARRVISTVGRLSNDRLALFGMVTLSVFLVLGLFGPAIAPYEPMERHTTPDSEYDILRSSPPSVDHPLGTTSSGRDVLSIFIVGARISLYVGIIAGLLTGLIGTAIGLISGYYGGRIDFFLMRITDVVYGLPVLGMALVLLALTGPSNETIIVVLALLLWRVPVRVIRSEVLSIKEKTYVRSSRVAGASNWYIVTRVVAPNVLPLSFLYLAYGVAWAIIGEASLAFLGFGDPETISWGRALQLAFESGSIRFAWWSWVPPAIGLSLVVTSVYLILRGYEEIINPELR